jgi:CDP-diacylglycerol--serine O-phosphatidyltransferase
MTEAENHRRSAIFLPNAITTASMFFGFYSMQQSMEGNFVHATWALFIAAIMDSLDGRIARLVKGTSEFGEQYDSLADLVSFGVAPAILAIRWSLNGFGEFGWAASFIYLAGAAIRLARFNVLIDDEGWSKSYFKGMPSPIAAGLAVIPVMVYNKYVALGACAIHAVAIVYLCCVVAAGFLMVSPVRFRTFKDVHFTKYGTALPLFIFVILLTCIFLRPQATFMGGLVAYISWAFIETFFMLRPKERDLRAKRKELRRRKREERKIRKQKMREEKMRLVGTEKKEEEQR